MVGAVLSDAKPYPKSAQLGRGERRYRRKVASPKQWQAIIAAKRGPCRVCGLDRFDAPGIGLQFHHVVSRQDHGDDVRDNIVPVDAVCHDELTRRSRGHGLKLLMSLTDAEYAYAVQKGGEDYFERAYGLAYSRESQR